jgi:competence ComEA-like helix-hairpin-helix protein
MKLKKTTNSNPFSAIRVNINKLPTPLATIIAILVVGMSVYTFVTSNLMEPEDPATPPVTTTDGAIATPPDIPENPVDPAAPGSDPAPPVTPPDTPADPAPPAAPITPAPAPTFPININTANVKTLILLPNIGEARANKIIAYRTANGLFTTIEDIQNVKGIGPEIFKELQGKITV